MSQRQGYNVYRIRRRRRLWRVVAVAFVLVLGGLAGSGAWLARAESGRLPPGVEIGGVDVGGLTVAEARARLEQEAARVAERPITLVSDQVELATSGAELGAEADIDRALAQAKDSRDTVSRLKARLGLADPVEITLSYAVSPKRLEKVLGRAAQKIEREPVPAGVKLAGDQVVVTPSQKGIELDADAAAEALVLLPSSVRLTTTDVPPAVSDDAAAAAKATADALLAAPPAIVLKKSRVELEPELVRSALRFLAQSGTIAVGLDPAVLEKPLRRAFRDEEHEPRDASFRVKGKRVVVVPARNGRELAVDRLAKAIVDNAGRPRLRALFAPVEPELTTEEAKRLGIRKLVSEFTTPYPCCAPRVANIQRAAEILDGYVIEPGARFSLNDALGERTVERGFVLAPMIEAGRLKDAIGGGVSQVATTFYNAAFFAGLELIAHTPHQFYISRYPMGREATVSWGGPELVFRNDWPAAILVKVAAGDTSITVSFYSTKLGRRVETETSDPYDYRSARTIREVNPALAPGETKSVQSGGVSGFSVDYTRKVYRGMKLIRNERYHVRYDSEDTIIEVGPKKPPKPAPAGGKNGDGKQEPPAAPPST